MEFDETKGYGGERSTEDSSTGSRGRGDHLVTVLVNDRAVKLIGQFEIGHAIKVAAIEQGVSIHLNFVLEEQLPDGNHRVVNDRDKVQLREGIRFIAHEPVIVVTVNEQPVKLNGHSATGAEIKAAAISQGVHIQANFVLQEELPNGTSRIIGDGDKIHLREHLRFTAIAPDDNS